MNANNVSLSSISENALSNLQVGQAIGKKSNSPPSSLPLYGLVANAVIAGVCAIAAVVFGQYALASIVGAHSAIDFIGAYYLNYFMPFRELEGNVAVMAEQVNKMTLNEGQLTQFNAGLKNELTQRSLQQEIDQQIITSFKNNAADIQRRWEETSQKLQEAESKCSVLKLAVEKLQVADIKLDAEIARLTSENLQLKQNADLLSKDASALEQVHKEIQQDVVQIADTQSGNIALNSELTQLREQLAEFRKAPARNSQDDVALEKKIGVLQTSSTAILRSSESLLQAEQSMGVTVQSFEKSVQGDRKLNESLAQLIAGFSNK